MLTNYTHSTLAEIELLDSWLDDSGFCKWLDDKATFKHKDSFEFIHHLFLDESESWYINNCLDSSVPENLKELLLDARNQGMARVCFYA